MWHIYGRFLTINATWCFDKEANPCIFSKRSFKIFLSSNNFTRIQKDSIYFLGVEEYVRHHIIRSENKYAKYLGDKEQNGHLSVLIPVSEPQMGTDHIAELFRFVCQNSCPVPGMNRRPVELLFTLEDSM